MKLRRIGSCLLTLALALSLTVPALGYDAGNLVPQKRSGTAPFTDTRNSWCAQAVQTVYEAGLMSGKTTQSFAPQDPLTNAQILVICARLHSLLNGGDGVLPSPAGNEHWYQSAVDYLLEKISDSDSNAVVLYFLKMLDTESYEEDSDEEDFYSSLANDACTRMLFVNLLSAVLPDRALTPINSIQSIPDSSSEKVLRFYNAGLLTGSNEYGFFNGSDTLNRGQAAAILARIVSPALRVKFSLKSFSLCRELLGLEESTPLLTVDGRTVTAGIYTLFFCANYNQILSDQLYEALPEKYPRQYSAYLNSDTSVSFLQYLITACGISDPIDWTTPDQGGLSLSEKLRIDTLQVCTEFAAVLNHEKQYPLSQQEKTEISTASETFFGFSPDSVREIATYMQIMENICAAEKPSASQYDRYLTENGMLYCRSYLLYREDDPTWDAELRKQAETLRSSVISHRNDEEYLDFLAYKYADNYDSSPDILELEDFTTENQKTLKALRAGETALLTEEYAYYVILRLDPATATESDVSYLFSFIWEAAAQAKAAEWATSASVQTTKAYDALNTAALCRRFPTIYAWNLFTA